MGHAIRIKLLLVAEGDRFESKNCFTGFVHRFDVVLVSRRGEDSAKFACGIDLDRDAGGAGYAFAIDTGDVGGSLGRFADPDGVGFARYSQDASANDNIVAAGGEVQPRFRAQGDIV